VVSMNDVIDPASGLALKVRRITRGVTAAAVAKRLGVSAQRVHQIEAYRLPSRAARDRYLAALDVEAAER
jgi:transcriptional regulator with XRE-family HTH domain